MPVMYYILRYFLVKNEGLEKNIKSEKSFTFNGKLNGHIDNYGL